MPWSSVAQFSPEDERSLSRHNEDDQENRCFVRDRVPGSLHPEIHVDARAGEPERKEYDGCRRCPGSAAEDAAGEGTKPEHHQPEGDHEDCVQGRLLCLTNVEALDLARCSEFEAKVRFEIAPAIGVESADHLQAVLAHSLNGGEAFVSRARSA